MADIPLQPEFFEDNFNIAAENERNGLSRVFHLGKRSVEGAILFAEVTPLNEAMRVAVGGVAIAKGIDPVGVAAIYGGATAVIEGSAAIAAASWLESDNSKRAIDWFNDKLEKRGISPEAKFSKLTKSAIAFLGGSAIVSAVNKRENPENTKNEDRKYGLKAAGLLAGACAVQGYFVAQGFEAPSPLSLGGALLAVSSVFGAMKFARNRVNKEERAQGIRPLRNKKKD